MLLRQLEKAGWKEDGPTLPAEQLHKLLQRISRAYTESDQERYLLSRSQELASREIEEIYLRLNEAQRIAGLGNWSFNLENGTGQWSDGCIQIFGMASTSLTPSYSSFLSCIHPVDREKFISAVGIALSDGNSFETEFRVLAEDKSVRWVLAKIQPSRCEKREDPQIHGTVMDISKHKHLEDQLLQSQKMEAIGTLVGGIAHDFNNMLAGIMGNTYLANKHTSDIPKLLCNIETIDRLSNRAADMIRQMLTFARKDRVEMQTIPATLFLKQAVTFAETAIPENIECLYKEPAENLYIYGDKTQLQQVIMNLMNNAKDALSGIKDGRISCTLEPYSADIDFRSRHPACSSEQFACLTVKDNGSGIDSELIDRIFDPFFTTKEVGKGTGLGLAMVYGAVKNHKGEIEVESSPDQGTVFKLYLPIVPSIVVSSEKSQQSPAEPTLGHSELILVADDDIQIRNVITAVLQQLGYRVMSAADGMEAARIHKRFTKEIDLAILDVVMPKMGGVDAAKMIRQSNPQVPIIFATGYDKEAALKAQQGISNSLVLNKPFPIGELSQVIKQLLRA